MAKTKINSHYADFFKAATARPEGPFHFQSRFAEELQQLVRVPTGAGKTAMAILGWLWRRNRAGKELRNATPRRLVYCLPMRVLVEQTRDNAIQWLHNTGLLGGDAEFEMKEGERRVKTYVPSWSDSGKVAVTVLMGGEDKNSWDLYPERDAIIIGTQDMLLSRALNRGYGMTRFRWPMHFGLLNNDAMWVFDEIQLMGSGLATTAQLEAFRTKLGTAGSTRSVWMSATLEPDWLKTVDFAPPTDELKLTDQDTSQSPALHDRMNADKPLFRAVARIDDADALAKEVLDAHQAAGRTLVVLNTVQRAANLFDAIDKLIKKRKIADPPRRLLLHSRYRPGERVKRLEELTDKPAGAGTIVVATLVIEAGVDISAKVMFTELAPWASLVQRFGRCNRQGKDTDAKVFWIDWPSDPAAKDADKKQADLSLPYQVEELKNARTLLIDCTNVGPFHLPVVKLYQEHTHVIRRKDFIELFDTTPDLAGNDTDVSRYVREIESSDLQIFWRET